MATNKNALIRYKILDRCFRNNGKKYFIDDLLEECNRALSDHDQHGGISRRQIFEDIKFMESDEGWSIELNKIRESKRVFYRYSNPSFSINNMPLNETEIHQLKAALDILAQFKGMPQFEWIHELIPKLRQDITHNDTNKMIIEFDSNQYLKGIEFLGEVYNAILYSKVLSIDYKPFYSSQSFKIIMHPYYLKQFNNRWFVYGLNQANMKYDWNIALDRILAIKELHSEYLQSIINWKEYFEDIIGVTKPEGENVEEVILLFLGNTGKYIESKPLHGSQRAKWLGPNILKITLNVILNYELERIILSYSDTVKVLQPKVLRESIQKRIKESLSILESY